MEITGHSTREMFDRYNRIDEEDTRKAIVQMQDFLASVDQTAKRGCGYCRNPLFYWRALEGSNLGPQIFSSFDYRPCYFGMRLRNAIISFSTCV